MRLEKAQLHEVREFEPLVIASLDQIEENLAFLGNQIASDDGKRPDILAVDGDGALTIIELKSGQATINSIAQVLTYFSWYSSNIAFVARTYNQVNPKRSIRAIIVAPDFAQETIVVAGFLEIQLELVKAVPLKSKESEEIGIYYEHLELEDSSSTIKYKSIEDIIDYIKDEAVKADFVKIIEEMRQNGAEAIPYKAGKYNWIEFRIDNEDCGYLQPRQRFFRLQYWDEEQEKYIKPVKVSTYEEWQGKYRSFWLVEQD